MAQVVEVSPNRYTRPWTFQEPFETLPWHGDTVAFGAPSRSPVVFGGLAVNPDSFWAWHNRQRRRRSRR